jgi:hypothetical protein
LMLWTKLLRIREQKVFFFHQLLQFPRRKMVLKLRDRLSCKNWCLSFTSSTLGMNWACRTILTLSRSSNLAIQPLEEWLSSVMLWSTLTPSLAWLSYQITLLQILFSRPITLVRLLLPTQMVSLQALLAPSGSPILRVSQTSTRCLCH